MDIVKSINGVSIRLTDERWVHIIENHGDVAGYYDDILGIIESPDYVIRGYSNALIALRRTGTTKFLAVVYKETGSHDGFVITAYFTTKMRIEREVVIWQRER